MSVRPPSSPEPAEEPEPRQGLGTGASSEDPSRVGSSPAVATEPTAPIEPTGAQKPAPAKKSRLRFLRELPVLIVIAFVLALLIKSFLVQAFYIPSESMDPTLKIGDRVLVEKVLTHPHRGWIVVFRNPLPGPQPHRNWLQAFGHWLSEGFGVSTPSNEDFIKRVVGLPGDSIEYRAGFVYVDGKKLNEPYLKASIRAHGRDTRPFGPCTVPAGHVFMMGDNRPDSNDSRYAGWDPSAGQGQCNGAVAQGDIVGRAFVIIWPPSRIRWLG